MSVCFLRHIYLSWGVYFLCLYFDDILILLFSQYKLLDWSSLILVSRFVPALWERQLWSQFLIGVCSQLFLPCVWMFFLFYHSIFTFRCLPTKLLIAFVFCSSQMDIRLYTIESYAPDPVGTADFNCLFCLLPPFCPGRSNPGRCQNMLHTGEKACDHHQEDDKVCHWTETS